MERLTVPDEPIEGGMRRSVVDARLVREQAMGIYWRLKAYEDTGLEPDEILDGKMLTGWIPVDERLPAPNERVLMYRPCMEDAETGPVSVQWGWAYKDATYWMPVPNAPEN